MKRLSVKQKLTLWITLLMLLLVVLVLGYMLAVSSSVVTEQTSEQLTTTLRDNLSGISRENGALAFSEDFSFTRNGVYTLVYGGSGALQAGQVPLSFPVGTTFENGVTRMVSGAGDDYFVLDYWLHFGWEDGVWVRGVTAAPDTTDILDELAGIALLLLPAGMRSAVWGRRLTICLPGWKPRLRRKSSLPRMRRMSCAHRLRSSLPSARMRAATHKRPNSMRKRST